LIQQFIGHRVAIHNAGGNVGAIRILIADDHKDFRNVVCEFLSRLPNVIVVGEADDGVEVIDKTESLDPDIVLMDITMPRRNGLDATRIIKNRWPLKKVVIATMHDNAYYRAQAEEVAADGFIVKSSIRSGLLATFGQGVFSPMVAEWSVASSK
jgi:DNA-binding NarL/FixJ family response regulator